jgi:hypothetical protein
MEIIISYENINTPLCLYTYFDNYTIYVFFPKLLDKHDIQHFTWLL